MTVESLAISRFQTQFAKHKAEVEAYFDHAHTSVYTDASLQEAISQNRAAWGLSTVAISAIVELLLRESRLGVVELTSESYASVRRYAWGALSPLELALSLKPNSYLSHGTAAYLRGLLREARPRFTSTRNRAPNSN